MQQLNWKQGLLRLYCAIWGVAACISLVGSIYWSFFAHREIELVYIGLWLGLAVLAPALFLGLSVWVLRGFGEGGNPYTAETK